MDCQVAYGRTTFGLLNEVFHMTSYCQLTRQHQKQNTQKESMEEVWGVNETVIVAISLNTEGKI